MALVSPSNNGKGATMAYNTSSIAFMRPNETKLTGPPPPRFASKKARTGGSG